LFKVWIATIWLDRARNRFRFIGPNSGYTGFELPSSWTTLPCYGPDLNRNILDFMRWPQMDLGAQDLNDIQRPKSFQKIAGSKVLDKYYNTYLRK
jgi:hypothetical protein